MERENRYREIDAAKPKLACFPRLITGCACQAIKQIIKQQLKRKTEQKRRKIYQKVENKTCFRRPLIVWFSLSDDYISILDIMKLW